MVREAIIEDIAGMQLVRNSVIENVLSNPDLIKYEDYVVYITERGKGWVHEIDEKIVGFAIADLVGRNIWALFVLPGFEQKGIGRQLHNTMLQWYFSQTKESIWLSTAPATRAEMFYRKAGWADVGMHEMREVKFEMSHANWHGE
jgi:GNAT superfamily N-acetyltransferase